MHQPNTELPVISADAARQPGAPAHRRCSYRIADRVTQWPPVAFQQRARRPGRADTDAEAMLAQLADLEARIAQIGCGPQDVLDDVERSSKWLHDKAFRRI